MERVLRYLDHPIDLCPAGRATSTRDRSCLTERTVHVDPG
jgi:hypothetical protein